MLNEVKKIVELNSVDDIDFITLKDEKGGLRCLIFSGKGSYDSLFIKDEPLVSELKSHAIANIIYGNQATKLMRRLCSWIQA